MYSWGIHTLVCFASAPRGWQMPCLGWSNRRGTRRGGSRRMLLSAATCHQVTSAETFSAAWMRMVKSGDFCNLCFSMFYILVSSIKKKLVWTKTTCNWNGNGVSWQWSFQHWKFSNSTKERSFEISFDTLIILPLHLYRRKTFLK